MSRQRYVLARQGTTWGVVLVVAAAMALAGCTSLTDGNNGEPMPVPTSTVTAPGPSGVETAATPKGDETVPAPEKEAPKPTAQPSVLPSIERPRAKAVKLTQVASPAKGVDAQVVKIETVQGEATMPGEIAGDALRVTLELNNRGDVALDLSGAVVNLYYGDERIPAEVLSGPGARALPANLASDAKARTTIVFRVGKNDGKVEIELDIADAPTIAIFKGTP